MINNKTVVYWTPWGNKDSVYRVNMLCEEPKPIIKTLPKTTKDVNFNGRFGNYKSCTSFQNLYKNTFVVNSPLSSYIKIGGSVEEPYFESENLNSWMLRSSSFDNRYMVDADFFWLFFSEDDIEMEQTAPYLHNPVASEYATVASGSFNISKWIRPFPFTYILWENNNELKVKENDPAFYLKFNTEKKVELKRFELTDKIRNIAIEMELYKQIRPKSSFTDLYSRFTKSHTNKIVLKEIKNNLLD